MTDIETINKLAEILGSTGGAAVTAYTGYYIYNAIIWLLVGVIIIAGTLRWKSPDWDFPPIIIKSALIFIGLLFIGGNLPDLLAPKAMAIHQLIRDIRQ